MLLIDGVDVPFRTPTVEGPISESPYATGVIKALKACSAFPSWAFKSSVAFGLVSSSSST